MAPAYVTEQMCQEREDRIHGAIRDLEARLYKDNGHESIQTRLVKGNNRMAAIEQQHARIQALGYVIAGGIIVQLALAAIRALGLFNT